MSKFAKRDNPISFLFKALFFTLPFRVFGLEIEIGVVSFVAPGILIALVIVSAMIGMVLVKHLVGPPWFCWLPLVLLTLGGLFAGDQSKYTLYEILGLEPKSLYLPGTMQQQIVMGKKRGKIRFLSYLLFALLLASFLGWLWYVYPRDRFEMEIKGDVGPIISFMRTWAQYVVPNYFGQWFKIFLTILTIFCLADFLPFTRELFRRTRTVEVSNLVIFIVFNIWMAVWWYNLYQPSF